MATEDELSQALVNAHAAGDEQGARTLANAILSLRASQPPAPGSSAAMPLDDTEHAAGPGTIARASLAPDPQVQLKRYAEAFNQPVSDFGIVGDHIVRRLPDTGQYARVEPSVKGATGVLDAAERAFDWVAGGTGQAIPAVASGLGMVGGAAVGAPTGPGALISSMAGGAAGAVAGEVARQKLDQALAPEGDKTPTDWGNVGWQGVAGAAGPIIGKGIEAVAGRVAPVLANAAADELPVGELARDALSAGTSPVGQSTKSFGLSPRVVTALQEHISGKDAELAQLRQDAQAMGIDLSLGQLTGSYPLQQAERQLLRQPETAQQVVDLRAAQNGEQIPGAVRSVLDDIAPDAPAGRQVADFRSGADEVIGQGLAARADAARPLYEQALAGRSIAPLEDQFSGLAEAAATAAKDLAQAQNAMTVAAAKGAGRDGAEGAVTAAEKNLAAANAAKEQGRKVLQAAQQDGTADAPGAVWNPRIQQFLDDPVLQAGLKRGLEVQRLESLAEGRPFNMTDFAVKGVDADGNPIVGAVPNMKTLDAGKKGLDAIIKDNTNDFGEMNQYANAVNKVRKAYLREIDTINPDYAPARAQWGSDSDILNAIKDGGVGFLNNMSGPDRQNMVNRVFSGQNLLPDDVAAMRQQFISAGKQDEWNAGVRSYVGDKLADAMKPLVGGGEPSNVGGKLYSSLFEDRQNDVIKAALGADSPVAARWDKLGNVLQAASRQLYEGSPTATDIGAPGLIQGAYQGVKAILHPMTELPANLIQGLTAMQKAGNAEKFARYALTPEGDKLLRAIYLQTPSSPKARSILGAMFSQAGIVGAEDATGQKVAGK